MRSLFGIGTFTQVNSINTAITNFFDPEKAFTISVLGMDYSIATVIGGIVVAVLVGLVVIGGIKRIASVSERVIPVMVVLYVGFSLVLLLTNLDKIPGAFVVIFRSAFGLDAAAGGMLGAIFIAMQKGIARGIFSNEAGLGSAPIAAAAAQTKEPVRQGLVSMTGTFLDTIVVCTMTGLALVMTGAYQIPGLEALPSLPLLSRLACRSFLPPSCRSCSWRAWLCSASPPSLAGTTTASVASSTSATAA